MIRAAAVLFALVIAALPVRAAIEIEEVTSPGGITAWLVEEPSIPFVAIELRFRGGASLDAPGKRGAVNLMTGLLEEGAGEMDAQAFARAKESLAADIGFDVGDDSLSVSARFLTENRDDAAELLRLALAEPRFDPEALERVRRQALASIASDAKDPNRIAGKRFDAMAFADHPYGTPISGTAESVAALTRDDIHAAHRAVLARDRVFVGVAGDITAAELGPLLDRLLGGLPETGAPQPADIDVALPGGVEVVTYDTPQSVVVFGQAGMTEDDPDFFAAYIMNQILGGGGFRSRLMAELREARGLTYGVYSYLVPKDHAALYMGSFASSNGRVAEAVDLVRAEWAKMAAAGVTAEELDAAKRYLTGAYPLRFDGNATIAGILAGMQITGRPIDYVNTRNARVEAVTLDEINRVAAELLDPAALQFVVVGQPEGLTPAN
jgi:zinc protease